MSSSLVHDGVGAVTNPGEAESYTGWTPSSDYEVTKRIPHESEENIQTKRRKLLENIRKKRGVIERLDGEMVGQLLQRKQNKIVYIYMSIYCSSI